MEIHQAEFVRSFADSRNMTDLPILPQIAVVGKSNVGKSSLINALTRRNKLAKVSSAPGKTRLINVFLINGAYHLVDLPGYGYAKVSKTEQAKWGPMIERYLQESAQLQHLLLLVDIRHEPTTLDQQMHAWLVHYGIPFTVVCTKADKLSRGKQFSQAKMIREALGADVADCLLVSSETGAGRDKVLARMGMVLGLEDAAAEE